MFTESDLCDVVREIRGLRYVSPFSKKKNAVSYRLSRMNSQCRGNAIEKLVRNYFVKNNLNVKYIGGSNTFDMRVNGLRVEVKSSLCKISIVGGKVHYSYNFKHIKPKNFDKLVMVYISPTNIEARIVDSRTVAKYLNNKNKHKSFFISQKTRKVGKSLAA